MRAFDDEVALTVAPFYLIHMLQRTLPGRVHRAVPSDQNRQTALLQKACFARLWRLLSGPGPELWRQYRAAVEGPERQREALELLASVVWHLELATSLASWPTQKMDQFYSQLLSDQTDALTPWKIWVDHYNRVEVTSSQAQILIDFSLRERADVAVYAVQNTLIADAAMRLDSAREVLRPISNKNSLVLM